MPSQGIMQQLKKEFSHLVQIHNSTPAIDGLVAMAEAMFSAPVFLIIIYQKEGNHLIHHQGVDINKVKLNTMYLHDLDQQDGNALILQESEKLQPLNTHLGLSKVQFYAGCALRNTKGESIGRVELMDHNPRIFSEKDIHLLELLAKQLAHALITEVNLKLAQTDLLTIFSNAPVAMLVVRPDNGKIIMVNKELQKLAETEETDLLGRFTTEFYSNVHQRDQLLEILSKEGTVKNLEIQINKKGGNKADCLVSTEIISFHGETMLLSGFIDISDRKQSETLLAINEERFRSLYNRTPVMLHSLNQEGEFLSVSDYWLAKMGYQREQVIGKHMSHFFTKSSIVRRELERMDEFFRKGYDFDIPYQAIKRNGETMDVLISAILEKDQDGRTQRILSVMQDVTEKKKLDIALQKSEDNLRTVFENTDTGYALLDADFYIMSFNQAMQKFAEADLFKTLHLFTYSILYFAEARQQALLQAMNAVLKGQTISYEINYVQADGSDKWYRMNMYPVFDKNEKAAGIIMAVEDINERKQNEIHLNRIVKEITDYKLALDESSIVFLTDEKGMISYANENCLRMTQFSKEEILHKNMHFLNSGYHSREFFTNLWQTIQKGEIWKGEIRNRNKSGQYFWVDCTIVPFIDKDRNPYQYIAIQRDITLSKNAEIELNKSFGLVNEQNKRLLNFSYIVSHNLRSHTSNILSILNFLEKESSEKERSELMMHLKKVSRSLNDTLFNLNEVVSIRNNINLVIEPLNLLEYINQALKVQSELIAIKKANIFNRVSADCVINCNPAYLESILLNFISNAIKYSHPDRTPVLEIDTHQQQNQLILEIADNGIGIDLEKNGDKLFGMYKTFSNNPDARGIGLFITKNQIDAMGGKVEVKSELGKGTRFSIYFNNPQPINQI
jgi:PAS domain S-box-containing protein